MFVQEFDIAFNQDFIKTNKEATDKISLMW